VHGFNGAALSEARKPGHDRADAEQRRHASMGPRFRKRGNVHFRFGLVARIPRFNGAALSEARKRPLVHVLPPINAGLQWGRAFGSAETALEAPLEAITAKLQWGRAFGSAETSTTLFTLLLVLLTSMGPRFRKRGNDGTPTDASARFPTSMGPRFRKRGNSPIK